MLIRVSDRTIINLKHVTSITLRDNGWTRFGLRNSRYVDVTTNCVDAVEQLVCNSEPDRVYADLRDYLPDDTQAHDGTAPQPLND